MINFIQENFYALLAGVFIINWTVMLLTGIIGRTDFKYKNMLFKISRWFFEFQGWTAILYNAWHLRFLMKGYLALAEYCNTTDVSETIKVMLVLAVGSMCLIFASAIKNSELIEPFNKQIEEQTI